jgi:hypothetical protein
LVLLPAQPQGNLADVLAADAEARRDAHRFIKEQGFA